MGTMKRGTAALHLGAAIAVLALALGLAACGGGGNGIEGAAGGAATDLLARGYRHAVPSDAPNLDYARSLVLFRPGWQREAKRLAQDSRIPAVAPFDGRVAPAYARVPLVLILGPN